MRPRDLVSALIAALLAGVFSAKAASWEAALGSMPLPPGTRILTRSNCVPLMLDAFQSNDVVKALVFMPGATDEFYMFHRATARLTNAATTLLNAVVALTNQTYIRATFHPPLLLLHTDEDPLEPVITIHAKGADQRLRERQFVPHAVFNDRDWNFLQPILERQLKANVLPWQQSFDSWHFYRHSLAAWNLNGMEAIEAIALAGKTQVTISSAPLLSFHRLQLRFEPDPRVRKVPTLKGFPR